MILEISPRILFIVKTGNIIHDQVNMLNQEADKLGLAWKHSNYLGLS